MGTFTCAAMRVNFVCKGGYFSGVWYGNGRSGE